MGHATSTPLKWSEMCHINWCCFGARKVGNYEKCCVLCIVWRFYAGIWCVNLISWPARKMACLVRKKSFRMWGWEIPKSLTFGLTKNWPIFWSWRNGCFAGVHQQTEKQHMYNSLFHPFPKLTPSALQHVWQEAVCTWAGLDTNTLKNS